VHVLAGMGAIGFAVHVMLSEPVQSKHEEAAGSDVEEAFSHSTLDNVPPPRRLLAPAQGSAAAWPPPVEGDRLDQLVQAEPEEALQRLARVLPHSEHEAQRLKVIEVHALVKEGKIGAARGRAQEYFARWPAGPDTAGLEQLTGAHPTR
jgi:hypothetical protein